jgi:hypothetical protein
MPFGENSIDLGNGVLYMIKDGVLHSDSIENESITWAFDPASMVDSVKKAEEFSFEVKLTTWQMIKIIFKHRGFWYTAAFIFTRMWNKLVGVMSSVVNRLCRCIEDKLI